MIHRFRAVLPGKIYRGSAPTPHDVLQLKEDWGINKIVSLDREAGDKISDVCRQLGIKQVKLYIDGDDKKTLLNALSHNLKHLLLDDNPTYIHCKFGKDRTSLISALFKCKYMGVSPNEAIKEAKSLGLGIGVPPHITKLYENIIKACKPSKDTDINQADSIVDNIREYKGDNRDGFLDEVNRGSFAPYLDHTKQSPNDTVYSYIVNQSPTRQNYEEYKNPPSVFDEDKTEIPQVGVYNNEAGSNGIGGFTLNPGGFIYD